MEVKTALLLLQVTSLIQNIDSSDTNSKDKNVEQSKKRSYNVWTPEMSAQLAEIYRNTESNDEYHFENVMCEWFKLHPDSNMNKRALRKRYVQISHELDGKGKRPKYDFRWDNEKHKDLVDAYLKTRPYNQSSSVELKDEWKRRHQDSPNYNNSCLSRRARNMIQKWNLHVEGESSQRLFEWTYRLDSDLFHINHVTLPEGKRRPISMHRIWADLHPDLRDLTYEQMSERVKYLQRISLDENFPWTKGQNKELLEIYYSTSPEVADQGQRIYDIWSKIHPRYSFMTPYYLQIHASTLAHCEEMKSRKGRGKTILTKEQKAKAVEMYQRRIRPNEPLYDFHKAWVREYPSLAYIKTKNLADIVIRTLMKNQSSSVGATGDEEQSESRQIQRRKYHKYTPEEKIKLQTMFYQTYPREYGHGKRLKQRWIDDHKDAEDINGTSLQRLVQRWMKAESDRKGKAPMVTPKTELESESFSNIPEMSE